MNLHRIFDGFSHAAIQICGRVHTTARVPGLNCWFIWQSQSITGYALIFPAS
jgi:hypothetical protein